MAVKKKTEYRKLIYEILDILSSTSVIFKVLTQVSTRVEVLWSLTRYE